MMRKAVTNGNPPGKEGSGRRYWMRASPVGSKAVPSEGPGKRTPKARFLEPYRLSDERRAALIELLASGGVGDGESRELFASAIEYDIANVRQALAREAPQPVAEPPEPAPLSGPAPESVPEPGEAGLLLPADLAHTARSLAERIAGLEGSVRDAIAEVLQGRDPFRRTYDGTYLEALCTELRRLADAVASQTPGPASAVVHAPSVAPVASPEPPPSPPLGEGARRFLRRVARVYEEVLECRADARSGSAFVAVLGLVTGEAGIVLPHEPAQLAEVLQG